MITVRTATADPVVLCWWVLCCSSDDVDVGEERMDRHVVTSNGQLREEDERKR
jgi:hypothetical protein